jgi:hypothetical protein
MRNLQEGRHALAEKVFHGRRRELFQRYRKGMEDQLDTLGIVLNCVVLWNTVYIDAALRQLQAQGYPAKDEDVARLSPFMRKHINVHGKYSFTVPKSAGPSKGATVCGAKRADTVAELGVLKVVRARPSGSACPGVVSSSALATTRTTKQRSVTSMWSPSSRSSRFSTPAC